MQGKKRLKSSEGGFTLAEVLATSFVLGVVAVTWTGLAMLNTRSSIEGEKQNIGQALLSEKLEEISTLGYDKVECAEDVAQGEVICEEDVFRNNSWYTINFSIERVDDELTPDEPEDYKKVIGKVTWETNVGGVGGNVTSNVVSAATIVSPGGDTCTPGAKECPNPDQDCSPGLEDACGEGVDCPVSGFCPDSETTQFFTCSSDGICPTEEPSATPTPTIGPGCSTDGECGSGCCIGNICQPCHCEPLVAAGLDQTGGECETETTNPIEACQTAGLSCSGQQQVETIGKIITHPECTDGTNQGVAQCGRIDLSWESCSLSGGACPPPPPGGGGCAGCPPPPVTPTPSPQMCGWKDCPSNTYCETPHVTFTGETHGTCTGSNCCSGAAPVCSGGFCHECSVALTSDCPNIKGEAYCDDDKQIGCICSNGKCAQCDTYNVPDVNHCPPEGKDRETICKWSTRECVECVLDQQCVNLHDFPEGTECVNNVCVGPPACDDNQDNDGDGYVDFGGFNSDPGCESAEDTSEGPNYECSDGEDNDGDSFVDYGGGPIDLGDPQCTSYTDDNEDDLECEDGVDNDDPEDTLADSDDPGCLDPFGEYNANDNDETDETFECNDGEDNDNDGYTDYEDDPGCYSGADEDESDDPDCSNGIDDDGDGYIDNDGGDGGQADPGCSSKHDENEGPDPACMDNVDNDGDGKIDWDGAGGAGDPGCTGPFDNYEQDNCTALFDGEDLGRIFLSGHNAQNCSNGQGYYYDFDTINIGGDPQCLYDIKVSISGVVETQDSGYDYISFMLSGNGYNELRHPWLQSFNQGGGCTMAGDSKQEIFMSVPGGASATLYYDTRDELFHQLPGASVFLEQVAIHPQDP